MHAIVNHNHLKRSFIEYLCELCSLLNVAFVILFVKISSKGGFQTQQLRDHRLYLCARPWNQGIRN